MNSLVAVFLAVSLVGCVTMDRESNLRSQLAVGYATDKIIKESPERALRVLEQVEKARALVTNPEPVSIAALDQAVKESIDWRKLDAADRVLVSAILIEARERLEYEIGAGVLDADQRVKVMAVLDWIDQSARRYVDR